MPRLPVSDRLRLVRLRTDADLPGVHTLSLVVGDAFRVWRTAPESLLRRHNRRLLLLVRFRQKEMNPLGN